MISCEPTTDLMEETDSTGAEVTLYLRRISLADVLGSFILTNSSLADHSFLMEMTQVLGAKPLSEPMMTDCQLDHKEHISVKYYLKLKSFHLRKRIWKYR